MHRAWPRWMIYAQLSTEDEKFRPGFLSTEAQGGRSGYRSRGGHYLRRPELVAVLEKNAAFFVSACGRVRLAPRKVTATGLSARSARRGGAEHRADATCSFSRAPSRRRG